MFLIRMFLIPLAITVVMEEIVSLIWGNRSLRAVFAVLWINVLTNLCLNGIMYAAKQFIPSQDLRTFILIVLEILVVLLEWRLFRRFITGLKYPLVFSIAMNAVSYGAGLLYPFVMQALRS